jgi:hypothetical protein
MTSDIANYGEEHGGKGVRAVVRQNLDAIESGIDATPIWMRIRGWSSRGNPPGVSFSGNQRSDQQAFHR